VPTLVLSDIHGNLPALEAVLKHARRYDYERVFFLGDAVGYYPDGDAVVSKLRELGALGVMGNHDAWMLTEDVLETDGYVIQILRWQSRRLSEENRAWLAALPWTRSEDAWLLVHGSPCDPFVYVDELDLAREGFGCSDARWIFHGHTHMAGAFTALDGPKGPWVRYKPFTDADNALKIGPKARAMVNPGSVGQPRDGVPHAGYAFWDEASDTVRVHRVPYDIDAVARRVEEVGFPPALHQRLKKGR